MTALPAHGLATDGLWSPARRRLTIGLVLTITLVAFESLAVATILPIVANELQGIELYGWVFSAFFLGSLIGIVVIGGWIDRGGLVRPYLAGIGLFAIGLVIGGLAPSMPILVFGRFLQGLGGGAIAPTAYVAIGRSLPESLRPIMFATLSTAWVLPGIVGPALAGAVAEHIGWRVVFIGLLPIIAFAGLLTVPALAAVPPIDPVTAAQSSTDRARRLPQAILLALGAGLFLAGLSSSSPILLLGLAAVGIAIGGPAFRRLTPPGTLRAERGLPAAVLLRGILTFSLFGADAYVPLMLQDWRGLSATVAGLVLTSATLAWTAGSWLQARRIEQWGAAAFVRGGFLLVLVGLVLTAFVLVPEVPPALAVVSWGIAGFGIGMAYAPLSLTVLRDAPPGGEGAATSGLTLSDVLGTALGIGAAGAIIAVGEPGRRGAVGRPRRRVRARLCGRLRRAAAGAAVAPASRLARRGSARGGDRGLGAARRAPLAAATPASAPASVAAGPPDGVR